MDEQVSSISCFKKSPRFVCGFESGSIRIFDISQCQLVVEVDKRNQGIISIAISPKDDFIVSSNTEGSLEIFNSNLELIKRIDSNNPLFDYN